MESKAQRVATRTGVEVVLVVPSDDVSQISLRERRAESTLVHGSTSSLQAMA